MTSVPYLGEMLSLLAAVLWALAIVLFRKSGESVHPVALNTFKGVLAMVLYLPTLLLAGVPLFFDYPASGYAILLASGVIGIAVGDTLFFKCINTLGASASALISCLYSAFIIGMSYLWLGERMSWRQLVGAALIISAVMEATRAADGKSTGLKRRLGGFGWGVVSMAASAIAVVMMKPILDEVPLLWALEVRLVGGVAALLVLLALFPSRGAIVRSLTVPGSKGYTISSSFIGGYVAMVCWLAGMKLTQASVASALNETSSIFVLIFAALVLRERITPGRVIAILMAAGGALLVTFG